MPSVLEIAKRGLNLARHRLHTLPVLVLMPHSRCNARCIMCDIWQANSDKRELSIDDLAPHLSAIEALGVARVVLSGGEALMHPNLWAFTELLAARGIAITLLTTGLTLAKHADGAARWCDEITVSVDGSPPVHDRIRRVEGAFDKLSAGLAAVRQRAPHKRITARCVVQRANFEDLPSVLTATRRAGFDQVSFLPVDVGTSAFGRLKLWAPDRVAETALSRAEVEQLSAIIEALIEAEAELFSSGFIAESPAKLRRIPQYFAALNGDAELPRGDCNAPWVSAVVEADGAVRPCFFLAPYGQLTDGPLDQILNQPESIAFRRDLDVASNPTCLRCVCTLQVGMRTDV